MNHREQMIEGMQSPELHERLVRTVMSYRRAKREDAEDSVQDAYLYALRTKHPWDGRAALRTWFTRVAINASLMRGRIRKKIDQYETMFEEASGVVDHHSSYDRVYAMERYELLSDVLVSEMPKIYRRAILFLISDPDGGYVEAIKKLHVLPNTFKAQIHRARVDLRAVL